MAQRAERLSQFISDRMPDHGAAVQILCEDHVGTYLPPFLCRWTESGWSNAVTSLAVEANVVGWRDPPTQRPGRRR